MTRTPEKALARFTFRDTFRVLVLAGIAVAAEGSPGTAELLRQGDYAAAAARFAERAAEGDRVAQNNLGVLHQRGQGVAEDPALALQWFERAAAQGLPGAMYNIGMLHLRGYGRPVDPAAAAGWFEKAAGAYLQPGTFQKFSQQSGFLSGAGFGTSDRIGT